MKGYKLWDPFARNVVISKDIIFDEKSMLESTQEEKKQKLVYCSSSNKQVCKLS